ncbi:MAG: YjbQ family protein [Anaerolineae bacterium]|nr:YjbQ family protein [Anaerolineae bacterium]
MLQIIDVETPSGETLLDITPQVREAVTAAGVAEGVCVLVVPHTTAAITLNSAVDGATMADIRAELQRLIPKRVDFIHQYDTPADAAGHVKAVLVGQSLTLVVDGGKLAISSSQSILFYEFDGPRTRRVQVKIIAG